MYGLFVVAVLYNSAFEVVLVDVEEYVATLSLSVVVEVDLVNTSLA